MLIGIIADDFTGATDIAGFLVANGLSSVLTIGIPDPSFTVDAHAVVVALKSRSCPVDQAIRDNLATLRWFRSQNCPRIYQKYCSTFDSTDSGNIGPVTDALLDAMNLDFTVVCPALPVNGRTVYHGYLFVNGVPLAESGMRNHPVTPMTDSNLRRLMERQSRGRCGGVVADTIDQGPKAVAQALSQLRHNGYRYAVLDSLYDAHLDTLGEVAADLPFVTGGSGLAAGMTKIWTPCCSASEHAAAAGHPQAGRGVIISGSCSAMTNTQVLAYRNRAPSLAVRPDACLDDPISYARFLADWVMMQPQDPHPMVYATTDAEALCLTQIRFGAEAAAAVETVFAHLAQFLAEDGITRFIIAGGETAGAVVQSLGISGFHVGPQIAPGVPWVRAINKPYSLALKSGNFGQQSFFYDCQQH